ncbi:MAG: transposase [Spirochaetia bacterium]|jgi:hypothetical protein|nr:transposase [Spirochaetia bacterium]MCH3918107.1 transposase [Spirochaetia bacterium]
MAFIKTQKTCCDAAGNFISGSASIKDVAYVRGAKYHSRQISREVLGKIIFLDAAKKRGVFVSPTRGLVSYDVEKDEFSPVDDDDGRIMSHGELKKEVHTVFGDAYLLLEFLRKQGLAGLLEDVFTKKKDLQRVYAHLLHGILRNGSAISCDSFLDKSFAAYLLDDIGTASLHCDSGFFSLLGDDRVKMAFFKGFVSFMKMKDPGFGNACYVDSTPLPNSMADNPFDALCSHGVHGSACMMRLVLVLDARHSLPVWFDIIPGNLLDVSTVMGIVEDVESSLCISVGSLTLDAGYASKEIIRAFSDCGDKSLILRMPARKGYPYKELYWRHKEQIPKGKYAFVRNRHTYFGTCEESRLFDAHMFLYPFVDKENALMGFRDGILRDEDAYGKLSARDKDFLTVKSGYFVLIANYRAAPKDILSRYFDRADIEGAFKTSKAYLKLLPLAKWTDCTVRGKILADMICLIITLLFRKEANGDGHPLPEIIGRTQSLMCFRKQDGTVIVETPNRQVKECYRAFGIEVPSSLDSGKFKEALGLKM